MNLRRRVSSYFSSSYLEKGYLAKMIPDITDIQWKQCPHELVALFEEEDEVKSSNPRFNSSLRDCGKYVYIAYSDEEFPFFYISKTKPDNLFFGPFYRRFLAEIVFDLLTSVLGLRTCRNMSGGCVRGGLQLCMRPCIDPDSAKYQVRIKRAFDFLKGDSDDFLHDVENFMLSLSENGEFERAIEIRDKRKYLRFYLKRAIFIKNFAENSILVKTKNGYSFLFDKGQILMLSEKSVSKKAALARLAEKDLFLEMSEIQLYDRGNILYSWISRKGGKVVLL